MRGTQLEDGLHDGISYADYAALPHIRASEIKLAMRGVEAFVYETRHPKPPTPSMRLGSALHIAVLEPDRLGPDVVTCQYGAKSQKGQDERAELEARGAIGVTLEEMQHVLGMRDSVLAHPESSRLLEMAEHKEVTALATVDEMRCKARPDLYSREHRFVADLKSTQDVGREAWERTLFNLGYYVSAAWYVRVLEALRLPWDVTVFIAVQNSPPYTVAARPLSTEALEAGAYQIGKYAARVPLYRWAAENPGASASGDVQRHTYLDEPECGLPPWAYRLIYEDENE